MIIAITVYVVIFIGVLSALPQEDNTLAMKIASLLVALTWPIYIVNKITKKLQK